MSPVSPQRCLIVQLAGTSCAGGDRCLMGTPVPCPPRATPNIAPGKGLLPLRAFVGIGLRGAQEHHTTKGAEYTARVFLSLKGNLWVKTKCHDFGEQQALHCHRLHPWGLLVLTGHLFPHPL